MLKPESEGDFEQWDTLANTLEPFLKGPVRIFLTWSAANAEALASGAEEMTVKLDGEPWSQSIGGPQKYHAKSLKEIRRKYSEVADQPNLSEILENAGCLEWLAS